MALHRQVEAGRTGEHVTCAPAEFLLAEMHAVPKHRIAQHGLPSDIAYTIIRDELMLDGNAKLNLATFVTTWMNDSAKRLMTDTFDKNMIDKDEYPQTAELERRCVNIIAELWNAPAGGDATGCSTTGSSEAAMLGGLALKWRWRQRRQAAGKAADKPNLVMGVNVQVCWEKFCRYWDVEPRYAPLAPGRLHLTADEALKLCDENTIGVVAILGSTFDGSYEPVAEICAALDGLQAGGGPDVPVHVDGASGGFVAPFIQPNLMWDFRLPRVQSINASGHKFGLVYPGVGWVVWRDGAALPEELVFKVNYLGGDMPTFALNFSRPGAQVCAQYFNFVHLGFEGFRRVQQGCQDVATYLSSSIAGMGMFELLSEGRDLPVFAFKLKDEVDNYTVFDISRELRTRGWLVPAYTFPEDLTDMAALRIVIRNGFGHDMADMLLADLQRTIDFLEQLKEPLPREDGSSFIH
jgi:glutamate decarboxylase